MTEYGYDISDMKAFTDESLSVEIPIESVPKDALEKILGGIAITRCKDCKYYEPDLYANPWGVCCHWGWIVNDTGHTVAENGYCYRAERKEE